MTTMSEISLTPDPRPLGKSGILVSPLAWGMWRFAGRSVTTPQIILFGITGGLMPCPAAFSVLVRLVP